VRLGEIGHRHRHCLTIQTSDQEFLLPKTKIPVRTWKIWGPAQGDDFLGPRNSVPASANFNHWWQTECMKILIPVNVNVVYLLQSIQIVSFNCYFVALFSA